MFKKTLLSITVTLVCAVSCYSHAAEKRPATAERHKTYGIECNGCHGAQDKKNFNYKLCLSCHESYAKVAERTKKLSFNPHKSHYEDLECNACHHGHKADENFCATCHAH